MTQRVSVVRSPDQRGVRIFDNAGVQVRALTFDVELDAGVTGDVTVSAYPRQRGTVATEHAQPGQLTLPMRVAASTTPIGQPANATRLADLIASLDTIRRSGALYTVATALGVYPRMVLSSMAARRAAGDGLSATFDLTWTQVELVDVETVEVPDAVLAALVRPSVKKPDPSNTATREASEREKTVAAGLLDAITGGD